MTQLRNKLEKMTDMPVQCEHVYYRIGSETRSDKETKII
jgi:hypothetical protein